MMANENAVEPDVRQEDGFSALEWALDNVAPIDAEDERPYWHTAYPMTYVSSFSSWGEAGQHLADVYDPAQYATEEITAIAAEISAEHETKEDQLRAALDFVQRNIRYLGIELGAGGYIPRAPELVLSRRFGDCKDVTLLLVTILEALDIKAAPLLVNINDGYGLRDTLPTIGAFDHVIVTAWLEDEQHFLDATLDAQMGNFTHMEQGDHGYGLIISPDSDGLFHAIGRRPDYRRDFVDTFDLRAEGTEVLFTSVSTYRGFEAERMNAWVDERGKSVVEQSFLSYFEDYFPTIEQFGPFLIVLNEDKAELNITGFYRIPDAWSENTNNIRKIGSYRPWMRPSLYRRLSLPKHARLKGQYIGMCLPWRANQTISRRRISRRLWPPMKPCAMMPRFHSGIVLAMPIRIDAGVLRLVDYGVDEGFDLFTGAELT